MGNEKVVPKDNTGVPTAEDYLFSIENRDVKTVDVMIAFTKLHLEAQRERIKDQINSQFDFDGTFKSKAYPKGIVNEKVAREIDTAYNIEENVK